MSRSIFCPFAFCMYSKVAYMLSSSPWQQPSMAIWHSKQAGRQAGDGDVIMKRG
jgi:hypothetical protein